MKHINIIVVMAALLCTNVVYALVWYVHPDSTLNSIQSGINLCSAGDTVLVGPGIYYENILWPNTQGIKLISEQGPDTTIIDGNQITTAISCATSVDSTTKIAGFTIQHGDNYEGGGIRCINASPTITDNYIRENSCGGGIRCYGSSNPIITYNTISDNTGNDCGGICCHDNASPMIANNVIADNQSGFNGGIGCWDSSSPTITNNTITGNSANEIFPVRGGGIYCGSGSSPTITYNTINANSVFGLGGGICCYYSIGAEIIGNTINGNYAWGVGGGISCWCDTSSIIEDNFINNNEAPYGMFSPGWGGGVYIGSSSPTLTGNTITMNTAGGHGGGIYSSNASPFIDSCTISFNVGDGIYCCDTSAPTVDNCNITWNVGFGIRNVDSLAVVGAENNWWGDPTGPYHPTLNPMGLGDTVGDRVDFDPWQISPGVSQDANIPPIILNLQVTPNPFTYHTDIKYSILDAVYTKEELRIANCELRKPTLKIYDATGRLVKFFNLESSIQNQESAISWQGDDNAGRKLPIGTYFVILQTHEYTKTRKILLIR